MESFEGGLFRLSQSDRHGLPIIPGLINRRTLRCRVMSGDYTEIPGSSGHDDVKSQSPAGGNTGCLASIRQSKKTAIAVLFIAFMLDLMLLTAVGRCRGGHVSYHPFLSHNAIFPVGCSNKQILHNSNNVHLSRNAF